MVGLGRSLGAIGAVGRTVSGQVASSNLLVAGSTGVAGLIVARSLGPSDRGILAVVFAWFTLMAYLGDAGMSESLTYFVAKNPSNANNLIRLVSRWLLVSGSLGTLVLLLAALPLLAISGSVYALYLALYALLLPLIFQSNVALAALLGIAVREWSAVRLMQSISYLALVTLFAFQMNVSLMVVYAVYTISAVLQLCFGWAVLRRHVRSDQSEVLARSDRVAVDDKQRKAVVAFSLRNSAGNIPGVFYQILPMVLLPLWLPPVEIGKYAVAWTVANLVQPIASSFGRAGMPEIAARLGGSRAGETVPLIRQLEWRTAVSAIAVAVPLALLSPLLLPRLLGPEYVGTGLLVSILCFAAVANAVKATFRSVLIGMGQPGAAVPVDWITLGVQLGLIALLAKPMGLWGVCVGIVIGSVVGLVAYRWRVRRSLKTLFAH